MTATTARPAPASTPALARPVALSYAHRGDAAPLVHETIDARFRAVANRFPDRDAVVCVHQRRRLSYAQLDAEIDRVARGLLALGVEPGGRVGIWSTDNVEWILLQLATARLGVVLVNVNPAYRTAELAHALRLAEVQHLFLIDAFKRSDYLAMLAELCPAADHPDGERLGGSSLPHLRAAVAWRADEPREPARLRPGVPSWAEMLAGAERVPASRVREIAGTVDPDAPVNIQFTSGTTGFPKAVLLTHHNILNNAIQVGAALGLDERDRLCVPVPFYHCFGMVVSNLVCFARGACVVIPSAHFEVGATLAAIESERCTALHGVPTMFVAELDDAEFDRRDLSSLRTGIMAGAPCPPELMRQVIARMGCRGMLIAYGETECSPVATITSADDDLHARCETVGRPLPHQELKVIDPESGRTVPVGAVGEICFRGYHVMQGYYGQPEATSQAIDAAGWLHSGDLGVLDAQGRLAITGRIKDMIIRGGENLYPAEIEAYFMEHPAVAEIAVFGVPDARWGEEVGAWVRLHPGAELGEDALRAFGAGRIAHQKIPRHVWFVRDFPRTVTGKIRKNEIRAAVGRWLAAGGVGCGRSVESFAES